MTDFDSRVAAAYDHMTRVHLTRARPPQFVSKLYHHIEEIQRCERQGKTAVVASSLAYLAALCRWYAESLEERAEAEGRGDKNREAIG